MHSGEHDGLTASWQFLCECERRESGVLLSSRRRSRDCVILLSGPAWRSFAGKVSGHGPRSSSVLQGGWISEKNSAAAFTAMRSGHFDCDLEETNHFRHQQ